MVRHPAYSCLVRACRQWIVSGQSHLEVFPIAKALDTVIEDHCASAMGPLRRVGVLSLQASMIMSRTELATSRLVKVVLLLQGSSRK